MVRIWDSYGAGMEGGVMKMEHRNQGFGMEGSNRNGAGLKF